MKYIAIDLETRGLNPYKGTIWSLSIHEGKKHTLIEDCKGLKKLPAAIKKQLEDPKICKIVHNGGFDLPYLELNLGIKVRNVWDTQICELVIQGTRVKVSRKNIEDGSADDRLLRQHSTALKYVVERYGFKAPDKTIRENFIDRPFGKPFTKDEKVYMAEDTMYLQAIQRAQEYLLRRDGLYELALLENQVVEKLATMKVYGIGFDRRIWNDIADRNENEFNSRMKKLPKQVSNWNSPAQVKKYFFNKGIMINSYDDLPAIYTATKNKVLGDFIAARELHKAVTSYGRNWFTDGFIDDDGRIRCDVDQIINTGRMSMSKPNLQQLPAEGLHRTAFVPRAGHVFVIGDFSGQEIGIMAAMAQEELWIKAMLRDDDVHGLTAKMITDAMEPGMWEEEREKGCTFPKKCKCVGHNERRKKAKINNFMLAYGGGPDRLAESTGMDKLAARVYVGAHRRAIARLSKQLEVNGREALETGVSFSADPYKRRRVLRGEEAWQIVNQGKNTPIQSAGANMLKLAMISLPEELYIALIIHDEIILEVPKKVYKQAMKVLKQVMEKSADYITGVKGLIKVEPRMAMNIMKD